MLANRLKILFVISKSRINKKGHSPLYCRITYREKRRQFAVGLFVPLRNWNSKLQKTEPPNEENDFINTQLSLVKSKINQAFLFLQVNEPDFSVDDLYRQYKGERLSKDVRVAECFREHNARIEKLVGKDLKQVTYNKYEESKGHLEDFIWWKYKTRDVPLNKLKYSFIEDYEYYLKTEKNLQQSTINKAIQRFRKVIRYAVAQDYMDKDPFMLYKAKRVKKEVVYLTTQELQKLEQHEFEIPRLAQIRDMFVFCCYTGLGFNEMANLEPEHIVKGFDGNLWIQDSRKKTGKAISVPLLPPAIRIMERYSGDTKILPGITNQKFNAYLKEIADLVGIKKHLTHHIARKTFATTVLLYNDVSMEVVSELLGHSKMQITQEHYGKVVQKKVSEEMRKLSKKIDK
ncbi:site-specific integrase [Sinomicrobium weinanense]|uniref:Site-specific integrase n=1 Tax=Sinomicrobium weinanense TaxID=2842200 RepID=A0A926JVW0_9FLAO|nr:site-specific integrase [Sinomicrobium weinanense]MBC9798284.1 site-specific integrase [Sinomicrobium weinanense]MBU3125094.1 site-specific integrase [Sinomicrobium weinanense]